MDGRESTLDRMRFEHAFLSMPVVISQVQTGNDPHFVKTRQRNVSTGGFEVALEEEEGRTGEHGGEVIGWLAVEAGTGTVNGHPYEAGHTADAVKDAWYTIGFAQAFSQGPRFVAGLASCDGWDSAAVRYKRSSLGSGSVQVKVEEDTAYDSETAHTSEVVAWWAIPAQLSRERPAPGCSRADSVVSFALPATFSAFPFMPPTRHDG